MSGIGIIGSTSAVAAETSGAGALKTDGRQPITLTTEGTYEFGITTGDMAAGLAAASPILEFRSPSKYSILHSIDICAASNGTGFAAGLAFFNLFRLKTHTVIATGGGAVAMTALMGYCRTGMATPTALMQLSATAALTIGSGAVADTNAIAQAGPFTVGTATLTNFTNGGVVRLYDEGKHPLVSAPDEGWTIRATVPATGVWIGKINVRWSELVSVPTTLSL